MQAKVRFLLGLRWAAGQTLGFIDYLSKKVNAKFDRRVELIAAGQGISRRDLNFEAGVHYVTTVDHSMERKTHLIILPDQFDMRTENAVSRATEADYATLCGEHIFTDDNFANIMFADGYGSGIAGCMSCISRVGKHI